MAYENSAGLGVHNHYGPRVSGGEQGVYKTFGFDDQWVIDLPMSGLSYKFPIRNNVKVYGVNLTFATGAVSALSIGGVDVLAATEASPVALTPDNTGVVAQTGGTGGYIIVRYHNVAGDDFPVEGV